MACRLCCAACDVPQQSVLRWRPKCCGPLAATRGCSAERLCGSAPLSAGAAESQGGSAHLTAASGLAALFRHGIHRCSCFASSADACGLDPRSAELITRIQRIPSTSYLRAATIDALSSDYADECIRLELCTCGAAQWLLSLQAHLCSLHKPLRGSHATLVARMRLSSLSTHSSGSSVASMVAALVCVLSRRVHGSLHVLSSGASTARHARLPPRVQYLNSASCLAARLRASQR